jgi:hypothetical protein
MMNGSAEGRTARWHSSTIATRALFAGVIGLVLFILGLLADPWRAFAAYLFAYVTVLTLVLGALIQVMISHVTAARWFTVLRKLTLTVTTSLPLLAILVLPILFGVQRLYPWAHAATLSPALRKLAEHRQAWLNVPFFATRAIIYVIVFAACGEMLRRWAARENHVSRAGDVVMVLRRQRRASAIGLVVVGLTLTLVAFDWLMPLDTEWYSTVYGVYVFAGGFVAALGLIALLAYISAQNGGALNGSVSDEHFGALGKLMLTFVIFWAYIAFSQFLIIWIGDIPADSSWYAVRGSGSWGTLALIVVIGQFAIPFVLLLSRTLKRQPRALAGIGVWLVIMHVLDVYWLVLPAFDPSGIKLSWMDPAALLMVGGLAIASAAHRVRGHVALPVNDPYIAQAVHYVEP